MCEFNVHGSVHRNNILVYKSQQDAQVTEFILFNNCSTCFGRHFHPYCCFALLKMGDSDAQNMYSSSSSCSGRIRFDSCSLYPQNEIGPSIFSSFVLCVFGLLVYILVLVQVSCLCPSSVCVVATFPGTVLFPLL